MLLNFLFASNITINANIVTYDLETKIFTATGNVKILYKKEDNKLYTLRCNHFIYTKEKKIQAYGKVEVVDQNGLKVRSDVLESDENFNNAIMDNIQVFHEGHLYLNCCKAQRENGDRNTLLKSTYSSCNNPRIWNMHAKKIVHDQKKKIIYYHDAYLKFRGLPALPIPYFSHPAFDVTSMGGFLSPKFFSVKDVGIGLGLPYYYPINSTTDFEITPYVTSRYGYMVSSKFRKNLKNNNLSLAASTAIPKHRDDKPHWHIDFENKHLVSEDTQLDITIKRADHTDYLSQFWMIQKKGFLNYDPLVSQFNLQHKYKDGDFTVRSYGTQDRAKTKPHYIAPYLRWQHQAKTPVGFLKTHNEFYSAKKEEGLHQLSWHNEGIAPFGMIYTMQIAEKVLYKKRAQIYPKGHIGIKWPLWVGKKLFTLEPFIYGTYTRPNKIYLMSFQKNQIEQMPYYKSIYENENYHARHFFGIESKAYIGGRSLNSMFAIDKKNQKQHTYFLNTDFNIHKAIYFHSRNILQKNGCMNFSEQGAHLELPSKQHVYMGVNYHKKDPSPQIHLNVTSRLNDYCKLHAGYVGNPTSDTKRRHLTYYLSFEFENECIEWEIGIFKCNNLNRFIKHKRQTSPFNLILKLNLKWQRSEKIDFQPTIPYPTLAISEPS